MLLSHSLSLSVSVAIFVSFFTWCFFHAFNECIDDEKKPKNYWKKNAVGSQIWRTVEKHAVLNAIKILARVVFIFAIFSFEKTSSLSFEISKKMLCSLAKGSFHEKKSRSNANVFSFFQFFISQFQKFNKNSVLT